LKRRILLGGALVLLTGIACLAILEFGLRLLRSDDRYYPYYPNSTKLSYPTEAVTPGVTGVSRFTANSLGTRGREPNGRERLRILTIGGSTTADTVLDDTEAWAAVLEHNLDEALGKPGSAWVANSGIDGLNSHHHLVHAKFLVPRLLPLDYVIVHAGANDLGLWMHHEDFDPHYLEDPDNWNGRIGESFRWSWHTPKHWPLYKRTELWKTLSWLKDRVESARKADADEIVQDAQLAWLEERRRKRKERESRLLPQGKMAKLPEALDSYEGMLDRIVLALRDHGVEPVLMQQVAQSIFRNQEERDRLWMGEIDGGDAYVSEDQYPAILAEYNRRMAEVAASRGVLLVELPERIEQDASLFYDGLHFNERGARAVARVLADSLIAAGALKRAREGTDTASSR